MGITAAAKSLFGPKRKPRNQPRTRATIEGEIAELFRDAEEGQLGSDQAEREAARLREEIKNLGGTPSPPGSTPTSAPAATPAPAATSTAAPEPDSQSKTDPVAPRQVNYGDEDEDEDEDRRRTRRRRRRSTIATSSQGLIGNAPTERKTLLGS